MENHHQHCLTTYNGPCNCEDLESVVVCSDCHFEVQELSLGDEGLSVCTGCCNIEQATELWTLEKFEKEGCV